MLLFYHSCHFNLLYGILGATRVTVFLPYASSCLFNTGSLMDDVYRMNYTELYFFKKCLKETGQYILAKAVVVRYKDGSELLFDDI